MKTTTQFIFILFFLFIAAGITTAQKKKTVATIFKPVGTVELKTEGKDWTKAKSATPLVAGDMIRTQENSFAIVKFLENSIIRVQEKSEVTISGEISNGEYSKNVHLESGEVGFQVKKRPNEKFEFSTPTSVASIRGTGGLLITGQDSTDVLILSSGRVDFKNLISNIILSVKGGQTGYSNADGTVVVEESSQEELRQLNQASQDDSTDSEGSNQGSSGPDSSATSSTGIKIGLNITAPVGKENQDLQVSVEITNSSIRMDSLKKVVMDLTLFYRPKPDQAFKILKKKFNGRTTKFTILGNDVFAPHVSVYAVLKLQDGSEFTAPVASPETNPINLQLQAGKENELKIPFTDPTGKKKTMIIQYK